MRRRGTRYTQTLHRIRLRLYAPNQRVPVTVRGEGYLPDPEVKTFDSDWYVQSWETEIGEVLFGKLTEKSSEEARFTEITDKTNDDATTTKYEVVKTTTVGNTEEDETSSYNVLSFNLDVSNNTYILTPPPIESSPETPELSNIVVGYNPRKVGRYNLLPIPRPNVNPDFRMLDSVTTDDLRQTQD